ncbi:MAG: hypothetical protein RL687_405 [Candidatus Parcubacteria bacterium]|jgi:hypothetical protein
MSFVNDFVSIRQGIKLSGLDQKEWFRKWYRTFNIIFVLIPLVISGLAVYFGYFNIERFLILGSLLVCFILSLFASFNIFRKEGDSKNMLILRTLTIPIGFIILMGFMIFISLVLVPFITNLLVKYI